MSDSEFRRTLPAAQDFYEALTAALEKFWAASDPAARLVAREDYQTIQNARLQDVDMDDMFSGFLVPNNAVFLGFALRQIEKDPTQNFDETLFASTGNYTWRFCGHRIDHLAAVMSMEENDLQKKLEAVGYTIEDSVIKHHPGRDANTNYDESYFSRLKQAQRKKNSGPAF